MTTLPPDNVLVMPAGKALRVCVDYHGRCLAVLWLTIGKKDGSVYTSFCAPPGTQPRQLIPHEAEDGVVQFAWDDTELIADPEERQKVSFHASGVIRSPLGRQIGVNLRLLTQRTLLCTYFMPHPDRWPTVATLRARDALLRQLLDDECPLYGHLFYQPAGHLPVLASNLEAGSFVVPIGFTGVAGHDRVLLHLCFQRAPRGSWPPRWVIGYPTLGGRREPSSREQWIEPDS
jgi:hypothetical protein